MENAELLCTVTIFMKIARKVSRGANLNVTSVGGSQDILASNINIDIPTAMVGDNR